LFIDNENGGGLFDIRYEDGDVKYSKTEYAYVKGGKHRKVIESKTSGRATVSISMEDGDVVLR